MNIPLWSKHKCTASSQKMFMCVDCGKVFNRTGGRQVRCAECSSKHKAELMNIASKKYYRSKKKKG